MPTAILIDGGFFLKRLRRLQGSMAPAEAAQTLHKMCLDHLHEKRAKVEHPARKSETSARRQLYRIFYYDCPPLLKKAHNPVTGKALDFAKTPMAAWRLEFFEELKKLRKVALRLGYLNQRSAYWALKPDAFKRLLGGDLKVEELSEDDVQYEVRQKGVDMKLGLDIASLAYKRLVDQIVLVAGDSDFVPSAKLARREGVDFVLDPMWSQIAPDLQEHVDGLRSVLSQRKTEINKA